MKYVTYIGLILLATLVLIIGYNFLNKYLFSKIKINKWLVLAIGTLAYFIPSILLNLGITINTYVSYIFSFIFAFFLLWFFELMGWTRKKSYVKTDKKNDITIKPKAKPNRIKSDKK